MPTNTHKHMHTSLTLAHVSVSDGVMVAAVAVDLSVWAPVRSHSPVCLYVFYMFASMSAAEWFINSNDQYFCLTLIETITVN